jgi:hypothetical protein
MTLDENGVLALNTISTSGNITAGGILTSNGYFNGSSFAVLAAGWGGNVYLRPNGQDEPSGQFSVSNTGAAYATHNFLSDVGYRCKNGQSGGFFGNVFNIGYGAGAQVWIDATNFGTIAFTSDYRVKKDIAALPSTWDKVRGLRPVSYTFADYTPEGGELALSKSSDIEQWGFIAHEVQEDLLPSAASGAKDEANLIQSLNLPAIVSALTKALQEAMARIEALEAQLGV